MAHSETLDRPRLRARSSLMTNTTQIRSETAKKRPTKLFRDFRLRDDENLLPHKGTRKLLYNSSLTIRVIKRPRPVVASSCLVSAAVLVCDGTTVLIFRNSYSSNGFLDSMRDLSARSENRFSCAKKRQCYVISPSSLRPDSSL